MKKVIMLLSNPFKPDPRVYKEARSLVNHGYDVTVLAWDREGKYPKKEVIDGIKIERIKLKAPYGKITLFVYLFLWDIIVFSKIIFRKVDVIHCHDFDTLPIGIFITGILNKKAIFDAHELYYHYLLNAGFRKLAFLFKKVEEFLIKNTEGIITATPGLMMYYSKTLSKKTKTAIIYNVAEKNLFKNLKKKNMKRFVVSYIGSIRYPESLLNLFEACKEMKDIEIHIVGGGIYAEEIKKESIKYPQVKVFGSFTYSEVLKFYEKSSCIYAVYGSDSINIKLAFPVKLFEAMMCGIPVIVDKNTDAAIFVERNKIGFAVDGNSKEEICKIISYLKNNPEICVEMGQRAKKLAEGTYNWELESKKLLKIYEEVLR